MSTAARLLAISALTAVIVGCLPIRARGVSPPLDQDSGLERVDVLIHGFV